MRCSPERLTVLLTNVLNGQMKYTAAGAELGLSSRQVRRLAGRFSEGGLPATRHRAIGHSRPKVPGELKERVIALVAEKYHDFGPTLASEKLAELDGIEVSREWLRNVMMEAGLWKGSAARKRQLHQLREPSAQRGLLIQVDGSHHAWFEGRADKCALLVFIDDATSELMHLEFSQSESSLAYMAALQRYIQKHGKPVALYSDRHSTFYNSQANLAKTDGLTQFGTALEKLNIGMICAKSPQAKGRVERANRTLQDRLVKELRLASVCNMTDGNAFLESYVAKHNAKFKRDPIDPEDAHTPLDQGDELSRALRWEESRRLTSSLVVHYNKVMFILDDTPLARKLARSYVKVCQYPNGDVEIQHEGTPLPYRVFDKLRRVSRPEIVDAKEVSAAVDRVTDTREEAREQDSRARHPSTARGKRNEGSGQAQPQTEPPTGLHVGENLRVISKQRSFSFGGRRYVLVESETSRSLISKKVEVVKHSSGELSVRYGEIVLAVGAQIGNQNGVEEEAVPPPCPIGEEVQKAPVLGKSGSNRLDAALELAEAIQKVMPHIKKRNKDAPGLPFGVQGLFHDVKKEKKAAGAKE